MGHKNATWCIQTIARQSLSDNDDKDDIPPRNLVGATISDINLPRIEDEGEDDEDDSPMKNGHSHNFPPQSAPPPQPQSFP